MGLAKNLTFYGIAAMAANIHKGALFLTLYGLPDPNCPGSLRLESRIPVEYLEYQPVILKSGRVIQSSLSNGGTFAENSTTLTENYGYYGCAEVSKYNIPIAYNIHRGKLQGTSDQVLTLIKS